jgi:hypothetical protein
VLYIDGETLIVFVYVDELLITDNNNDLILRLKKQLIDSFDTIDLGTLHYFCGLQVFPLYYGFFISHFKYVMDILTHFNMTNFKPCATPFKYGVNPTKTYQTSIFNDTLYQQSYLYNL